MPETRSFDPSPGREEIKIVSLEAPPTEELIFTPSHDNQVVAIVTGVNFSLPEPVAIHLEVADQVTEEEVQNNNKQPNRVPLAPITEAANGEAPEEGGGGKAEVTAGEAVDQGGDQDKNYLVTLDTTSPQQLEEDLSAEDQAVLGGDGDIAVNTSEGHSLSCIDSEEEEGGASEETETNSVQEGDEDSDKLEEDGVEEIEAVESDREEADEEESDQQKEEDSTTARSPTPPPESKSVRIVNQIMKEGKYNPNNVPTDLREDEYYYEWVDDILEAFPNKSPPYTTTRLNNTIYIGSLNNADDTNLLKRIGITHVLNCAGTRRFDLDKNPYEKSVGIKEYLMIPAEDFEDFDIVRHFSTAFNFIDRCKNRGGKCLIHCNMGINRSGAVCAGYMMTEERKPLLQVITELKKARQQVLTNRGFRYQLINFARMKNLLDPIAVGTGLPVTIPPPTGHSKFSKDSKLRSMTRKGTSDVPPASDFLPASKTSGAHAARQNGSSTDKDEVYIPPRPRSACGTYMDPPVSSRSFTRSSSAMGVYRKPSKIRPYSLADAEVDDYANGLDYADESSPASYTSYTSYNPSSKPFSWQRNSGNISVLNEGISYGGDRRSSPSSYTSSTSSSGSSPRRAGKYSRSTTMPDYHSSASSSSTLSSSQPAYNMINILKASRGGEVGGRDIYSSSSSSSSSSSTSTNKPYHTFSVSRLGGISFNLPKPSFGTSRRRFGPSKGISLNY